MMHTCISAALVFEGDYRGLTRIARASYSYSSEP